MNIDTPTTLITPADTQQKAPSPSSQPPKNDEGKSFKDELISVNHVDGKNEQKPQTNPQENEAAKDSEQINALNDRKNEHVLHPQQNNLEKLNQIESLEQLVTGEISKKELNAQNKFNLENKNIDSNNKLKEQNNLVKEHQIRNGKLLHNDVLKSAITTVKENNEAKAEDLTLKNNLVQSVLQPEQNLKPNADRLANANKDKLASKNQKTAKAVIKNESVLRPLQELSEQIKSIKSLKTSPEKSAEKTQKTESQEQSNQTIKMTANDALFFANLVKGDQISVASGDGTSSTTQIKNEATSETVQVSTVLVDALSEAAKTNKPFRIDFDKDVAIIMKIDRQGKLSAEFIPGDKAVETYLKNNIGLLQATFEEQKLPYNELTYRKHKQEQQNNNDNQRNKENDDE